MPTKRKSQDKPVNINELPQQQAAAYVSTYSNNVEAGITPWDFRFLFFEITEDESGELIREKKARVVMSPQHAVAFSRLLNNTVARWMKDHASDENADTEREDT